MRGVKTGGRKPRTPATSRHIIRKRADVQRAIEGISSALTAFVGALTRESGEKTI